MKRFAISITVLALSVSLLAPLQASARSGPSIAAVTSVNLTAVAAPNTVFGSPVVAMASGPVALPGDITYARFWIDLPNHQVNHQVNHPSASFTCAQGASGGGCQYMGTSYGPGVYYSNYPYSGGSGVHAATVQLWRDTPTDPAPVFVGQASAAAVIP